MCATLGSEGCDVVIPVYNEADRLEAQLRRWQATLDRLQVPGAIRVYDDGSEDATPTILKELGEELPRLVAVRQPNRGHGPTVLRGYLEARSEWVCQADGDGEVDPAAFGQLWVRRGKAPLVLACRKGRLLSSSRRLVSGASRCLLAALGKGVPPRDPNSPFRLWARGLLQELLRGLPSSLLVPNLVLTARGMAQGVPWIEVPVGVSNPSSGTGGLRGWRLMKFVLRATAELAWHTPGSS